MKVESSNRKGKRYVAIFKFGSKVHFGQMLGQTYIDHGEESKRVAYIARHSGSGRENWEDPYSPGALSRWLLWGDSPSLEENIRAFRKRFNV
jgi:hypothetical protein